MFKTQTSFAPMQQPIDITATSTSSTGTMQLPSNVRVLCARLQTMLRRRKQQQHKRSLKISAPFNPTHEPVAIPGISEDEIAILREKAAASRIGIAEMMPTSPSSLNSHPPMSSAIMRPSRPATAAPLMI